MGVTRFPHGASSFGAPVVGGGLPATFGNYFYVSSLTGNANYDGLSTQYPLPTIALALDKCVASNMDVIVCLPGHNEGFGDAQLAIDVAGVSVIGVGQGTLTPRIDFDHANASIDITASNVLLRNFRLLPSVTAVLIGIDVNAAATDVRLEDIEILPGEDGAGVDEFALGIDVKAGCDRLRIKNFKERQHASAAGTIAGIRLTGASDDITIDGADINIIGAGVVAPINGITTLSTNVYIRNAVLVSDAEPGIEMLTGTTGVLQDVDIYSNLATLAAAVVGDGFAYFRVQNVEVAGESGGVVGTASVDD